MFTQEKESWKNTYECEKLVEQILKCEYIQTNTFVYFTSK